MVKSILGKSLFFSFALLVALAAGAQAQHEFTFDLDVDCSDNELRSLVRSFFSREINNLKDAHISQAAGTDYAIDIIGVKSGRDWTMSVLITAPFTGGNADSEGYVRNVHRSLEQGDSTGDLGDAIVAMVKEFDREILKPRRKEMKSK